LYYIHKWLFNTINELIDKNNETYNYKLWYKDVRNRFYSMNKISYSLHKFLNKVKQGIIGCSDKHTVYWVSTQRCNLRCKHCSCPSAQAARIPDMPLSDFEKMLDEIIVLANPEDVTIVITGGEPLMRDDILDIGDAIIMRGFRWILETNGFLLNLDMQKQLSNKGLSEIILSLDGMEKNHNWFRGHPNSFENSLYAIKQVVRFYPEIDLKIRTIVNKKNLNDLDLLKDMLIQLKVKTWLLQIVNPDAHNTYTPISELLISDKEHYIVQKKIKLWNSSQRIVVKYSCNGNKMNGYNPEKDIHFYCPSGGRSITLNADGHVTRCPKVKEVIGNIYNTDLKDILEKGLQVNDLKSFIKGCNRLCK